MPKSGGRNCSVLNCYNNAINSKGKGISFHKFPTTSESNLKLWSAKIWPNSNRRPTKWSSVCSEHFLENDFYKRASGLGPDFEVIMRRLKHNAVPSLKLQGQDIGRKEFSDHDYVRQTPPVNREVSALKTKIYQLNEKIAELTTQVEVQSKLILELKDKKQERQFCLQSIAMDNRKLEFYTGFKSKEDFDGFYRSLGPDVEKLNDTSLDNKNQLFLFLCRIKAGLIEEDLAYRFGMSISSVSNIWKTWLEFLDEKLPRIMSWPTKEILDNSVPKSFMTGSSTIITKHKSTNSSFKTPTSTEKLKKITRLEETRTESPPRFDLSPGIFSEEEITPHCDYERNNPQTSNYSIWQPYNSFNYGTFYQSNTEESKSPQNEITVPQLPLDRGVTLETNDKGSTSQPIYEEFTIKNDENLHNSQSSDSTSSEINSNVNVVNFGGVVNRYKIFKYIFPNSTYSQLSKAWRVSAYLENLAHSEKPKRRDLLEKREAKEKLKLGLERIDAKKEPEETM